MLEEQYKAKCPGHILMADTAFFEADEKQKKKYAVIDLKPPAGFQMGIVLERITSLNEEITPPHSIQLYFTPEQYLDRCLEYKDVPWQDLQAHYEILDLTNYRILVDGRQETVETGAYKIWGECIEFYSCDGGAEKTEAVYLTVGVPEQKAFQRMRRMIYSLFEEVRIWKKERENIDEISEMLSIKKWERQKKKNSPGQTKRKIQRNEDCR